MLEINLKEEVFVVDLFSARGVFVNNLRIKPLQKTCITFGDTLKLASKEISLGRDNLENVSCITIVFAKINIFLFFFTVT